MLLSPGPGCYTIGRLKVIDSDEPQSLLGPITTGGKLLLTREQWVACQGNRKKGEPSSAIGGRKRGVGVSYKHRQVNL